MMDSWAEPASQHLSDFCPVLLPQAEAQTGGREEEGSRTGACPARCRLGGLTLGHPAGSSLEAELGFQV